MSLVNALLEKTHTYILLLYIFLTTGLPRCLLRAHVVFDDLGRAKWWEECDLSDCGLMAIGLTPQAPAHTGRGRRWNQLSPSPCITVHQPALLPLMRSQFPRQTEEALGHGIPKLWDIKVQRIERGSDRLSFTISQCSRVFLTRPSILCVTHQMSRKKRYYSVDCTVPYEMMNYKWYLMVLGQYMTILAGTWSV